MCKYFAILSTLIAEPTCNKNPETFLYRLNFDKQTRSFQNSCEFETGFSDFHKMTVVVMKMSLQKLQPRITNCRDYKKFGNTNFREVLQFRLAIANTDANDTSFLKLFEIWQQATNHPALCKQKGLRGHLIFKNKPLSKKVMKRTRLTNKFLRKQTGQNQKMYAKQRNYLRLFA